MGLLCVDNEKFLLLLFAALLILIGILIVEHNVEVCGRWGWVGMILFVTGWIVFIVVVSDWFNDLLIALAGGLVPLAAIILYWSLRSCFSPCLTLLFLLLFIAAWLFFAWSLQTGKCTFSEEEGGGEGDLDPLGVISDNLPWIAVVLIILGLLILFMFRRKNFCCLFYGIPGPSYVFNPGLMLLTLGWLLLVLHSSRTCPPVCNCPECPEVPFLSLGWSSCFELFSADSLFGVVLSLRY